MESGQKQDEKNFLGYEFSKRRGYEVIKFLPVGTKLFDVDSEALNPQKVNSYIYNAFLNKPSAEVSEAVAKHVSYSRMSGFFEYGTKKFDKRVNLNKKRKIILTTSKYDIVQLGVIANIIKGQTMTAAQAHAADIPVVAGGLEPSIYHDVANREAGVPVGATKRDKTKQFIAPLIIRGTPTRPGFLFGPSSCCCPC